MPAAKCIEIIDGATIRLEDGSLFYYEGVVVPPTGTTDGDKAKNENARLTLDKLVTYEIMHTDSFQRRAGRVVAEGINVNQELQSLGYVAGVWV